MLRIELSEVLPKSLAISSSGGHFFQYGISSFSVGSVKRAKFNHPIFVFIIPLITIIKSIISLSLNESETEDKIFFLIGDWTHFLGVKVHANILLMLSSLFVIYSLIIHYFNNGKHSTHFYLHPFLMVGGQVPPLKIGVKSIKDVEKLLKLSNILFKCSKYIFISFSISGLIFSSILLFNMPSLFYIPIAILHMIQLSFGGYFLGTFFAFQISYFYLIAVYVIQKIRHLNKTISKCLSESKISKLFLFEILLENHLIQREIYKINEQFVSEFLFGIIFINGSFVNFAIYVYLFVELNLLMKNLCLYFAIIWLIIFLIILEKSSQIVYQKNRTYYLLRKMVYTQKFSLCLNLKV